MDNHTEKQKTKNNQDNIEVVLTYVHNIKERMDKTEKRTEKRFDKVEKLVGNHLTDTAKDINGINKEMLKIYGIIGDLKKDIGSLTTGQKVGLGMSTSILITVIGAIVAIIIT